MSEKFQSTDENEQPQLLTEAELRKVKEVFVERLDSVRGDLLRLSQLDKTADWPECVNRTYKIIKQFCELMNITESQTRHPADLDKILMDNRVIGNFPEVVAEMKRLNVVETFEKFLKEKPDHTNEALLDDFKDHLISADIYIAANKQDAEVN